jgi:hypothetical protein
MRPIDALLSAASYRESGLEALKFFGALLRAKVSGLRSEDSDRKKNKPPRRKEPTGDLNPK